MDVLIEFISKLLGIPYDTAEGSIAVIFLLLVLYLVKVLGDMLGLLRNADARDEKQTQLEQTLVNFAVQTLNSYNENKRTIEANTDTIRKVGDVLSGLKESFEAVTGELTNVTGRLEILTKHTEAAKPVLDDIRDNLIKTSRTSIIVVDSEGIVLATLVAAPDVNGNLVVKVTERIKQLLSSEKPSTDELTKAAEKAVASIKEEENE